MRIGDWSSDVCTSALVMQVLRYTLAALVIAGALAPAAAPAYTPEETTRLEALFQAAVDAGAGTELKDATVIAEGGIIVHGDAARSEEHTSELQSLMRISYAVFCLKKKKTQRNQH